ncbi:MAG: serine--tRNA ligase [Candidatus Eisenbacteria bacterium]|uniref:Serine--tRNA ligase n=1 Tax=Eiseniibacteriota bacterium TaxID=2212470 RepID=A0A538T550_UNCEI|nr:MAG: serine--tRNA ligase [Candidatus Eisenbacteria bacterium]
MLDLKRIRTETDRVREAIAFKKTQADLDRYLLLDEQRRELLAEAERLKHERNAVSEEIGRLKRAGKDAPDKVAAMKRVGEEIKTLDARIAGLESELEKILVWIPNVPHPSVPRAGDAAGNVVVRESGTFRKLGFKPKQHWELAESLGLLDFDRAGKIAGAGFLLFTGRGARLERALIQFMIDSATRRGYTEVWAPHLVRRECLFGTGQLPKLEEDMYRVQGEDLFLNPTAEVPITNIYREETLDGGRLPINHVGYCASYRREAGAYGRETRGMIRVHQFDKVELVKLVRPETSYDEHEKLLADAEAVLDALELPHRVVLLAAGDLSFAGAKCYDLETWAPGEDRWLEVSSCSNFEDFQARRAGIRFRPGPGAKAEYVHTLNASGLALPRTFATLLEYHQTERGSVRLPDALLPYWDGEREIGPV